MPPFKKLPPTAWLAVCLLATLVVRGTATEQSRDLRLAGRRVALVIGNDDYKLAPLRNARNDANAMATTLESLGFTVTKLQNVGRQDLARAIARFGDSLNSDDIAFFYFAGHGVQVEAENYLIPVDFEQPSAAAVRLSAIKASDLQVVTERARVAVLVFDACRVNPFAATRGGAGLAPMEARGNLIAFATSAGQAASDESSGANGLFTSALLAALNEPGLSLRDVFYRTRQSVYSQSSGRQMPAVYDGLLGDVVLKAPVANPTVTASPSRPPDNPAPRTIWSTPATGRQMVWVPPGRFVAGSPSHEVGRDADEAQVDQVMRSGFWLDVNEVTNEAFSKFASASPEMRAEWGQESGQSPNLPATNVTWRGASAYCAWEGGRLPTEVEWEYAARGGTSTAYWWGATFDPAMANNTDHPVGVGAPAHRNPFGIIDILGNVWEWTSTPDTAARYITRGGAFSNRDSFLRAANRNATPSNAKSPLLGFRCAR